MAVSVRIYNKDEKLVYTSNDLICIALVAGWKKEWDHGIAYLNKNSSSGYGWTAAQEKDWSKEDLEKYFEILRSSSFSHYVHPECKFGNIIAPLKEKWNYAQHQIAFTLIRDLGEYPARTKAVLQISRLKRRKKLSSDEILILGWWWGRATTSHGIFPRRSLQGVLPLLAERMKNCNKNNSYASENFIVEASSDNFPEIKDASLDDKALNKLVTQVLHYFRGDIVKSKPRKDNKL